MADIERRRLRLVHDRDKDEAVDRLAAEFTAHFEAVEGQWVDDMRVTRGRVTEDGRQIWNIEVRNVWANAFDRLIQRLEWEIVDGCPELVVRAEG